MAYTPCYRREAGSAGRDTRGLLRVHEFDKVEILAICDAGSRPPSCTRSWWPGPRAPSPPRACPTASWTSAPATSASPTPASFDIEVYAPGCDMWLEVSSVSWFSDYQARRAAIRYRPAAGGPNRTCDTLNGSALAVPRVWAAVVETYRQPDGSVALPACLHPYFRGITAIAATPANVG